MHNIDASGTVFKAISFMKHGQSLERGYFTILQRDKFLFLFLFFPIFIPLACDYRQRGGHVDDVLWMTGCSSADSQECGM